jgi:signal transduction histidine kinase
MRAMATALPARSLPARTGALAWTGGGVVLALVTVTLALRWVNRDTDAPGADWLATGVAAALAFGALGALVAALRPRNPVGWLALAVGLSFGAAFLAEQWAILALLTRPGEVPGGELTEWLRNWLWVPGYALVPTLLLALLPDGRLPSPRWRPLVPATVVAIVLATLAWMLLPYGTLDVDPLTPASENPVAVHGIDWLEGPASLPLVACVVASIAAFAVRARRATGVERQQLRWIGAGVAVALALLLAAQVAGTDQAAPYALAAGLVVLPAAVGVAVLRHGLWELRPAARRSVVAAALGLAVMALYGTVVLLLGDLLGGHTGAPLVATALVAVLILPLHARLDRAVNRLFYGVRDEPWAAVRRLGERLQDAAEPGERLAAAAGEVAQALRLPYVEVSVPGARGGAYGAAAGEVERIPLVSGGEEVGELRAGGRRLGPADRRALAELAPALAAAAHNAALAADLQRSRERLVLAREEERRRLRNDLHDELGPSLAMLAMRLDAARDTAPEAAEVLRELAGQARDGVAQVRRIVHDLRPPALDDLGLGGALEERLRGLDHAVALEVRGDLTGLPAAVEAAAYRIVLEALANVARHADARHTAVTLERTGAELSVTVADDGRGVNPAAPRGVGLASVRERAEELGGTLRLERAPGGGTRLEVRLPCAS